MTDNLDDFVSSMQEDIDKDTVEHYGQAVYERWKNPTHMERISDPDGQAKIRGGCGDTMEMYLKLEKGRVARAGFMTNGCISSIVCGSVAAEMAQGMDCEKAASMEPGDILDKLGGLPEDSTHCAVLAAGALREAVENALASQARDLTGKQ